MKKKGIKSFGYLRWCTKLGLAWVGIVIFGNCAKSLLNLVGYKLKGIPTDEYFIFKSFVDIKKQELF